MYMFTINLEDGREAPSKAINYIKTISQNLIVFVKCLNTKIQNDKMKSKKARTFDI